MGMDKREEKREYIGADAEPDYKELIIDMVGKIKSDKLLEYLYNFIKTAAMKWK